MKICLFTIVLDGMPWITHHYKMLAGSNLDWRWTIVEGTALPTKDTAWVAGISPRLSMDGTTEYVDSIKDDRVKVIRRLSWQNKTEMVNAAVAGFPDCVLMQVDSDELWTAAQLEKIVSLYARMPGINGMKFFCRYFIGPDIVTVTDNAYGNNSGEWLRSWRFRRGMRFNRHEPPTLNLNRGFFLNRDSTRRAGLVFDHMSWVTESQVRFKCEYYGKQYANGLEGWKRLQENKIWPAKIKDYLPWVDEKAYAAKVQ
jgi:hypothetical protein